MLESGSRSKTLARVAKLQKTIHSQARAELQRQQQKPRESDYINLDFILGTNDLVERFFSQCKYVISDHRAGLSPYMFECIMFLKANKHMWDLNDVVAAMQMKDTDQRVIDDAVVLSAMMKDMGIANADHYFA